MPPCEPPGSCSGPCSSYSSWRPPRRRRAGLRRRPGDGRRNDHRDALRRHDSRRRAASPWSSGKAGMTPFSGAEGTTASSAARATTASTGESATTSCAAAPGMTGSREASGPTPSTAKGGTTSPAAMPPIDTIGDTGAASTRSATRPARPPASSTNPEHPFSDYDNFPTAVEGRGVYVDLETGKGDNGLAPDGGGVDEEVERRRLPNFETVIGTPFPDYIVGTPPMRPSTAAVAPT